MPVGTAFWLLKDNERILLNRNRLKKCIAPRTSKTRPILAAERFNALPGIIDGVSDLENEADVA